MAEIEHKQGDDTRQNNSSSGQLYNNRSRARPSVVEARVDPTYGQRSAIPGLDNESTTSWDDDDETSLEALKYLRSVR